MSADSQWSASFGNLDQQVKEAINRAQTGNWTRLGHASDWDMLTRLHTEQRSDAHAAVASSVVQLVYLHTLATVMRGTMQRGPDGSTWPAIELIEQMLRAHYADNDKIRLLSKLAQIRAMLGYHTSAAETAERMLALAKANRSRYFIASAALVRAEVGPADKHQLAALKEALKQLLAIKEARDLLPDDFLLLLCTYNRLYYYYRGKGKMFRARHHGRRASDLLAMFDSHGQAWSGIARIALAHRFSPVLLPYSLFQPYSPTR